jgi:uncharacterized OsmC-like protein
MGKISREFKPFAESWLSGLKNITDPNRTLGTARADATIIGDQASEVRLGEHHLISDEPKPAGGTDLGPNPLDYFMSSVGFCENVTFARYATLYGLEFETLQTSVRGHWDRRGQGDFSDNSPCFLDFIVETRVTSEDPMDLIKHVVTTTHRRCPMHATIMKVGKVMDRLFVNGVEVPL